MLDVGLAKSAEIMKETEEIQRGIAKKNLKVNFTISTKENVKYKTNF